MEIKQLLFIKCKNCKHKILAIAKKENEKIEINYCYKCKTINNLKITIKKPKKEQTGEIKNYEK